MTNKRFLKPVSAFVFLALAFIAILAACSDNSGSAAGPLSEKYTATQSGTTYELTITQSAANTMRAVFTPKQGDAYILKITANGTTQTSNGTVRSYAVNIFVLAANNNASVTFEVTVNGNSITGIAGPILAENGSTITGPGPLTPSDNGNGQNGGNGGNQGANGVFTSWEALADWLKAQPNNTAGNPYSVKVNVDTIPNGLSLMLFIATWNNESDRREKYFSLDLSGSSFTSIPDDAFGAASLVSVTIPNSVTSIGSTAFMSCVSLTSVTIPNGVTSIRDSTFQGCASLANVNIPSSVTSIGDIAFNLCTSLASITIPDSVTSIGGGAFSMCDSLASINIPSSVTSIGSNAFAYCKSLASVNIPNGVTSIRDATFGACPSLASIIIPDSVTIIGEYAFAKCTSLKSVTIPASVNTLVDRAFEECTNLTSVTFLGTIPKSRSGTSSGYFSWAAFPGDLQEKFFEMDEENGTPGRYTTTAPVNDNSVWTRQ